MHHRTLFAVLFTLLSLAGTAKAQTDNHIYDNIHSIGVVSSLVPAVVLTPGGPIPLDWDINGDVTRFISGALKERFSTKAVSFDRDQLQKSFSDDNFRGLGKFLHSAPSQDVDAYLVVIPDKPPNYSAMFVAGPLLMSDTVSFFPGMALTDPSNFFVPHSKVSVTVIYDIAVINAHSGELISWSRAHAVEGDPHKGFTMALCENDFFPRTADEVRGSKGRAVLDEMKTLVLNRLPDALKMMNLPSQIDLAGIAQPPSASCKTIM